MADYFISYSSTDRNFAQMLYNALEGNGFDAWIDHIDLRGGNKWRGQVTRAIKESLAVILVISPRSMASDEVAKEVGIADSEEKTIIPIIYEGARLSDEIAYSLGDIQWIDFQNSFQDGFERLIKALPVRHGGRSSSPQSRPRRQISLVGRWQVRVNYMAGFQGMVIFDFYPNGAFEAREQHPPMLPNQFRYIRGSWNFTPPNMITVNGIESQMGLNWGTQVFLGTIQENFLAGRSNAWAHSEWERIG